MHCANNPGTSQVYYIRCGNRQCNYRGITRESTLSGTLLYSVVYYNATIQGNYHGRESTLSRCMPTAIAIKRPRVFTRNYTTLTSSCQLYYTAACNDEANNPATKSPSFLQSTRRSCDVYSLYNECCIHLQSLFIYRVQIQKQLKYCDQEQLCKERIQENCSEHFTVE